MSDPEIVEAPAWGERERVLSVVRRNLDAEMLGELVHTSLRKGCEHGGAAHQSITAMPAGQWYLAMLWTSEALIEYITQDLSSLPAEPGPAGGEGA